MRKFAPMAMLMALLTALLMGGAASAQAADSWKCVNDKSIKLISCTLNDITIKIDVKDVADVSDVQVVNIEKSLNENDVIVLKITTGDIEAAKNIVVKIANDNNVKIDIDDVKICILAVCK